MFARIATKASCLLFFYLITSIGAKAQIVANFTASPTSGCVPLVVRFTDNSTGNPTSWKWDLGNNTISYLRNPSVTYFTPGKYTIKLVAKDQNNADSIVKLEYITVYEKPLVQFGASTTTGCFPLPVQFSDMSVATNDSIVSWRWDFGDGISSSLQNPSHTYNSSGNFNVTLQVRNSNGCVSTLSKAAYVVISSGALAKFTNNAPNNCAAPVTINFQNQSTGTGTLSYQWIFGDGNTSVLASPSHAYTVTGTYDVTLIVTNNSGCTDTLKKLHAISLGTVRAGFTNADPVCKNTSVQFTSTSVPTPSSVAWSFGDGTVSTLFNPTKPYSTTGSFIVKLVANFGTCSDSISKTILVGALPVANFTSTNPTSCKTPLFVNFTNQFTDAATYTWFFGDGTRDSSNNPSPVHTYATAGNYSVVVIAKSSNGCTTTFRKQDYVKISKPKVVLTNLPDSGCIGFTKVFSCSTTSADSIVSYQWDFGDGTTSIQTSPVHTYNISGTYNVSIVITTATGCTDTARKSNAIIITPKPQVSFTATPRNTCANNIISFADQTTGGATKWLWNFGDGATSTLQNPGHKYVDTGFYDVQLIVWNRGCPDTVKYLRYIYINPPVAKFRLVNDCKKPYYKVFIDQSIGADLWFWDFGDGNTSTTQSPSHTYAQTGQYMVSLKVINNTTGCEFTTIKPIDVVDVKAAFTAEDTVVCKGNVVHFNSPLISSVVRSFNWNFGDTVTNTTTNTNSTDHIYNKTGTYSVRLITTDIIGCIDTLVKPLYLKVNGPTAKFSSTVAGTCLNTLVIFNDSSITDGINAIQSWTWNYGDSTTETLTNGPFQHAYNTSGQYSIKLKVTDVQGCTDSATIARPLIVSKPLASFVSLDTLTCPIRQIRFANHSTGPGLLYNWNFGDTTTSSAQNPVHQYADNGSYSVKLVITDQYGCTDSVIRVNYININTPVARFLLSDSIGTCPPLLVQFTDQSAHAISWSWDFGDTTSSNIQNPTHFYTLPGTYIAKLTATGPGGCTSVMQRTILIRGPKGTFNYAPVHGCNPVNVSFSANTENISSLIWDFNDGSTLNTIDSTVNYTYTFPGSYVPKLILIDRNGCQVPIRGKDTIVVYGANSHMSYINKNLCDSGRVSFSDSSVSNDSISTYQWNFGDGGTAAVNNPGHQYSSTGLYYPSLIIHTVHGCTDTSRASTPIRVVASPQVSVLATANGCTPLRVRFQGDIVVPDTSVLTWRWNFANGSVSNVANPGLQSYTTPAVYNIQLIATNRSGCADTAYKSIEAYMVPVVNAGPDTVLCKGSGITLRATGALNYSWTPAIGLSCANCANPVTATDSAITYMVTGSTIHGCYAQDSITVKVRYPFVMTKGNGDILCKGQSKKLTASGANSYVWTPSAGLTDPNTASPTAQPDTTTNYRVIGSDAFGCFKDTGYVLLKVYPIPTVEAGENKTINVGQSIDLIPIVSSDVSEVIWSPTSGLFRNVYPGVTVKPTENTEYTVEVKNRGGCNARDKVSVFVICNGGNVFIPNTFSPDGNGTNDVFYPRGTGLFKIKNFKVFNRWGELVFENSNFNANDESKGWNGTYKGAKMNSDVFVYIIEVICSNNSVLTFKGNVALLQ